jgi:hypothetical protein
MFSTPTLSLIQTVSVMKNFGKESLRLLNKESIFEFSRSLRWTQALEVAKFIKASNANISLLGGDLNEVAATTKGPVYNLMTSFMKDSLEDRYPGTNKVKLGLELV